MLLSRRRLLLASTLALSGAALSLTRRSPSFSTGPKLRDGHPILRLPVPSGSVVLCQQGNASPSGRTHAGGNCLYALDLSNHAVPSLPIVSAARGRVAFAYSDSPFGDSNAGLRFGNQVKVEHGDGYFTFYSHLETICVRPGDLVESGDLLGTMGCTGAAGNRHLHFSLHRGKADEMGVSSILPMRALIAADLSRSLRFESLKSTDLMDGQTDLWSGRLYGSENSPHEALLEGEAHASLSASLQRAKDRLHTALVDRKNLDDLSHRWELYDAEWARQQLAPILERDSGHAVARYWYATAVYCTERDWRAAEAMLSTLLEHGRAEPTWEMWLRSWIHNRLGQASLAQGRSSEARAHFLEAARMATARPELQFARERLRFLGPS